MTRQTRWLRRLVGMVVLPLFLAPAGCMSFLNPVATLPKDATACCAEVPGCCRNHVYVFIVHGMDPLDCANLRGLRDYVQSLGFLKTYYGQLYHESYFAQEICRIHKEDPGARFALVGFSFGANMVRDICHRVEADGVQIDLLFYLGGNTLHNVPEDRPANAAQIVNILAAGCVWNGDTLDNAINVNYDDVYHFGSPTHPQTLTLLAEQLTKVACRVPMVERTVEVPDEAPRPRPFHEAKVSPGAEDEWDFLKPHE